MAYYTSESVESKPVPAMNATPASRSNIEMVVERIEVELERGQILFNEVEKAFSSALLPQEMSVEKESSTQDSPMQSKLADKLNNCADAVAYMNFRLQRLLNASDLPR